MDPLSAGKLATSVKLERGDHVLVQHFVSHFVDSQNNSISMHVELFIRHAIQTLKLFHASSWFTKKWLKAPSLWCNKDHFPTRVVQVLFRQKWPMD